MQRAVRFSLSLPSLRDYLVLFKPGIGLLVVFTAATGMLVAPVSMPPLIVGLSLLAITLGSGAAGVLNQWFDRDIDKIMRRTSQRPIPSGRVEPNEALLLGSFLSVVSVVMLWLVSNWFSALLLAGGIAFYIFIYTMWLKRRTPQNIVIGGISGAFPPLIGWAAATGDLSSVEPWLYFLLIFLWTPAHFWALALHRHQDYKAAKIPMLPVVAGEAVTLRWILGYSVATAVVSILPWVFGEAGSLYLLIASVFGGLFVLFAFRLFQDGSQGKSLRFFGFSILYLFAIFAARMADHIEYGGTHVFS